ncbi:hypothetical protein [Marinoscillum sp.]|uniref:hypothetical protein n=1 Tax=Marinoscillum sp. TaxID=2024838 RepID=UPI003BA91829
MHRVVSRVKSLWYKITHWEFWPFAVLYFPINFYYPWLAFKCRSLFFFTAANPSIDFGGMLGESKSAIFELIPRKYLPDYQLIAPGDDVTAKDFAKQIGYPLIAKPDIGERGRLVEKIINEQALEKYLVKCPVPFLMQKFIPHPLELGVFFVKNPHEREGRITSIVEKDFLSVIGNGQDTIRQLLHNDPRARLQINFSHQRFQDILEEIPGKSEKITVEGIGNHCRGTTFLNANSRISEQLNRTFNTIAGDIQDFHFGRFDLRCTSWSDLEQGKNIMILELNGAGAEPGHIYQPGFSLWQGYQSIFWHLSTLAKISKANHEQGVPYWTFAQGWKKMKMIRAYNRIIESAL